MEITQINYKLIQDSFLSDAVEKSNIHQTGGVNYSYNGKIYNVALVYQAEDPIASKVEALFIRVMGESEFYLGGYGVNQSGFYNGITGNTETPPDLVEYLKSESDEATPQFKETLNSDFYKQFQSLYPSLMPQIINSDDSSELKTPKPTDTTNSQPPTPSIAQKETFINKLTGTTPPSSWPWARIARIIGGFAVIAIAAYAVKTYYWDRLQVS